MTACRLIPLMVTACSGAGLECRLLVKRPSLVRRFLPVSVDLCGLAQSANVAHCTQTCTDHQRAWGEHTFVFQARQTSESSAVVVYLHSEFSSVFTTIRQVRLGCNRLFVGRLSLL